MKLVPDDRSSRPCVKCGESMHTTLRVVILYDGSRGVEHPCGTVYTREFMRDHFGIEWEDIDPLTAML